MIKPYLAAGVRKNGQGFIIAWIEPSGVTHECSLITCECIGLAIQRLRLFVARKNDALGVNPEIYRKHSKRLFKARKDDEVHPKNVRKGFLRIGGRT